MTSGAGEPYKIVVTLISWLIIAVVIIVLIKLWKKSPKKCIVTVSVIAMLLIVIYVLNENSYKSNLENLSCGTVTEIIHDQLGKKDLICEKVTLGSPTDKNFYAGKALLSSGKSIDIGVKVKDDGTYQVQL